jgi:uncharacterized membrane protein HdeD (DUF308 family)
MDSNPMLRFLTGSWWVLVLRGVVAILFAVCAFVWPGLTISALVILFGAFALVDGVFAVVTGVRARWWSVLIFGLLGIAVGVLTFLRPNVTALALLLTIGVWAIVRGVLEIAAAIQLRKVMSNGWLILSGLVSLLFGVLVVAVPRAGALSLLWAIAIYLFFIGVLTIALAFQLRSWARRVATHSPD